MPGVFAIEGQSPPGTTYYRRFVGNGKSPAPALEPGRNGGLRLAAITDGEAYTLLFVEARDPVPWTQPGDLVYDPGGPVPDLGGLFDDGFHVGLVDGTVVFVPKKEATEPLLRALITRNGGEPLARDWLKQHRRAVPSPAPRK
jgi:hypothetical protein